MSRYFDKSPQGRMNFREIAVEVRKRSGNRSKPSDIQIVNAIGQNAYRPHSLVPKEFEYLRWDASNSISPKDAESWMTKHLVPYFAALKEEWDDQKEFKRRRKGFQGDRLAHMREIGYEAFKAEFEVLHEERRTREDVDGWLLKKHKDDASDFPAPVTSTEPSEAPQRLEPPKLEPLHTSPVQEALVASEEPDEPDATLLAAEKTYTGPRREDGTPWLRPFREHSGVASFSAKKRSELWPKSVEMPESLPVGVEPKKWVPEWSATKFYKFRNLLNIPEHWKSKKVVLIWRGPDVQDLRVFTDSKESANSVVVALTGVPTEPNKLTSGKFDYRITKEQYDTASGD